MNFSEIETLLRNISPLFLFYFFIIGLCIGSFFNVVILRYESTVDHANALEVKAWLEEKKLPFPESLTSLLKPFNIAFPASHCCKCKTPLKWYHNIPLFSYLFLKGKCAFCNVKISRQYPIIELLVGLLFTFCYIYFIALGIEYFIAFTILALILFLLVAIDFKSMLLPDFLNFSLLWIGLILNIHNIKLIDINLAQAIYGIISGYGILFIIAAMGKLAFKKEAMGQGDFKLLAALGAFIGIKGVIFTVFASPFIGLSTWVVFKILHKDTAQIPYGPALIICSIIYIFLGERILSYILL